MFSIFKRKSNQPHGMKRFRHENAFSLLAPSEWQQDTSGEHFSLSAPSDAASITGSAYSKDGGSLDDFAEHRFSSVQDFYAAVGKERRSARGGLEIIVREFEGTWPGERQPTYYVVACIQAQDIYVSLGTVTSRSWYDLSRI